MESNANEQKQLKSTAKHQSSSNRNASSSQPLNDLSGDCGSETKRKQTPSDENIKHSDNTGKQDGLHRKTVTKGKAEMENHDQSKQKVEEVDNGSLTKEELKEHIMHLKAQVSIKGNHGNGKMSGAWSCPCCQEDIG